MGGVECLGNSDFIYRRRSQPAPHLAPWAPSTPPAPTFLRPMTPLVTRLDGAAVRAVQTAVLEGNVNVVKAKRQAEGRGIGALTREPRTGRRRKKPGTLEEGLHRYQNRPRQ